MQDPSEGVDRTTTEEEVNDGPSYTPSCLWRRVEKIREDGVARRLDIVSAFCLFSFSPRGLYSEIRITILWIM